MTSLSRHSASTRSRTRRPWSPFAPRTFLIRQRPSIRLQSILDKPIQLQAKKGGEKNIQISIGYVFIGLDHVISRQSNPFRNVWLRMYRNHASRCYRYRPFEENRLIHQWNVTMRTDCECSCDTKNRLVGLRQWWTCKIVAHHELDTRYTWRAIHIQQMAVNVSSGLLSYEHTTTNSFI